MPFNNNNAAAPWLYLVFPMLLVHLPALLAYPVSRCIQVCIALLWGLGLRMVLKLSLLDAAVLVSTLLIVLFTM